MNTVIPANAGIQNLLSGSLKLDPSVRWDDIKKHPYLFYPLPLPKSGARA